MPISLLAIIHVMLAHWAYYLFPWVSLAYLLYFYLFVVAMGLLVIILAILTHWAYYLFPWTSSTHLLYFYLLLCLWACLLSFLPYWRIELITSFLGLRRPIYFTFTSCCAYRSTGCHSCHIDLLGLLSLFLGFPSSFTLLLPLVVPMGLLAVIPIILAHWAYYLFPWAFPAHLLYFYLFCFLALSPFLVIGLFLLLGLLLKNGYQHFLINY